MVSRNVSLDVAFSLDEAELIGWNVAIGEIESGKTFNWNTMSWPE